MRTLPFQPASPTASRSLGIDVGVVGRELMAAQAMRAGAGVVRPAFEVHDAGHSFKMRWINASRVPAEMVDDQALRDGAFEVFIGPTVSADSASGAISAASDPEVAISPTRSSEKPARLSLFNEFQESIYRFFRPWASLRGAHGYTAIVRAV